MLTDWIHWLSSRHPNELLLLLLGLLLTDVPRYALSKLVLCLWCWGRDTVNLLCGRPLPEEFTYCPSVCAVVAGHNEEEVIESTLASLWGTYPRLEIIVVDDGSTDGMAAAARRFARAHPGVQVLQRPDRGGKSSALNWPLSYTQAEVIVVVDADSELGPSALWEIVQPLRDPRVGAVSGAVVVRNPFHGLVTWLQAYEYLSTIFIGRMVYAWMGILGIISGAFGAFRRTALDQVHGWDVGPPEDLDLTLAIRKLGYRIAFAAYAQCFTEAPTTWWGLIRQRLRWDRSGVIRNHCRKHLDMACFWSKNFRLSNLFLFLETWFFSIMCTYGIWVWAVVFCFRLPENWWQVLVALYLCYIVFELIQVLTNLYFTPSPGRDLLISVVFIFMPFYQVVMLAVRLVATTQELLWRASSDDNYVPRKVREATWRW